MNNEIMNNDIIDISMDFDNFDEPRTSSSASFGGGIELLMNDQKANSRISSSAADITVDDLDNLETELNNLTAENNNYNNSNSSSNSNSNNNTFFGLFGNNNDSKPSVSFSEEPSIRMVDDERPNLGHYTASADTDAKTWDGYGKFNHVPINPDAHISSEPKLSRDELMREKFKYLRKLEALEKKGVELTKKYNMESNLQEMMGEYEMIMEEKTKQNSIKFQGNMMMAIINGIEYLNGRFDPFDVKLDGWGEQINENMTDYDDVFGELYEKYKSKASLAPEVKLLFQLGGSAMMVHMSNTMFKSGMPNMDDIMRQNPDLMQQFQTAAVKSMATSNPGFSGFMNGLMNDKPSSGGGPPPPVQTQGPYGVQPPPNRGGNNVSNMNVGRGDISMARGGYFEQQPQPNQINIHGYEPPRKSSRRPDMKGPSDISDILSGLKTKTIEIAPQQQQQPLQPQQQSTVIEDMNNSTISLDDLKSIQGDSNVPKRSRRRPKSDRNTVSLDV